VAVLQLRLRAVRHKFSLVLAERARLSREIHDTLLQSFIATALELEAIANRVHSPDAHTEDALRSLRRKVQASAREARNSIADLRSPRLHTYGLVEALREEMDTIVGERDMRVQVSVHGDETTCTDRVKEQIFRISQEAVANAVQHGRPTQIDLSLDILEKSFILRIADDGIGFDLNAGLAAGHWGLLTMTERAEGIGGHLRIESRLGNGTVVELEAPTDGRERTHD
jgi:signal transduction histidine kinase